MIEEKQLNKILEQNLSPSFQAFKCLLMIQNLSQKLINCISSNQLNQSKLQQIENTITSQYHKIIDQIQKTRNCQQFKGETQQQADVLFSKGQKCCQIDQNYKEGYDNFSRCLRIKQNLFGKGSLQTLNTILWIGDTYYYRNFIDRSIFYYKKGIKICKQKLVDDDRYGCALFRLGSAYKQKSQYAQALKNFQLSLQEYEEQQNEEWKLSSAKKVAICLKQLNEVDRSNAVLSEYGVSLD